MTAMLMLLTVAAFGQTWTNYDSSDGLIEGIISNILIDDEQVVWFVDWTEDLPGIGSFDGTNWEQYGTEDGTSGLRYQGMLQDPDGDYWFGSFLFEAGLDRFDGTNWTNYTEADGLLGGNINDIILGNDGNIWIINGGANSGGMSSFDGTTFVNYVADGTDLPFTTLRRFDQDSQGRFWIATTDAGVVVYDLVDYTQYGIPDGLSADRFETVFVDDQDQVWAGVDEGVGGGLNFFDGSDWTVYTQADGLPNNSIRAIFQDSNGFMWLGTNFGISRFDGTNFLNFDSTDGLIEDHVRAIQEDAQGNLWIGTWEGVSVLNPTLGIFDNQQVQFSVAPNPARNFIELQSDLPLRSVKIYDLLGRLQQQVEAPLDDRISTALAAGSYWVVVEDEQGRTAFRQLLVN